MIRTSDMNAVGNKHERVEIAGVFLQRNYVFPSCDSKARAESKALIHCFHYFDTYTLPSLRSCYERTVVLSDERTVSANQCGLVKLTFYNYVANLQKVLHIPALGYNLDSTGCLTDSEIESCFWIKLLGTLSEANMGQYWTSGVIRTVQNVYIPYFDLKT